MGIYFHRQNSGKNMDFHRKNSGDLFSFSGHFQIFFVRKIPRTIWTFMYDHICPEFMPSTKNCNR